MCPSSHGWALATRARGDEVQAKNQCVRPGLALRRLGRGCLMAAPLAALQLDGFLSNTRGANRDYMPSS